MTKRNFAITGLVTAGLAGWIYGMAVHYALADASDTPKDPWAIHIKAVPLAGDDEHSLELGWYVTGVGEPVKQFSTQEACETFLKTDKRVTDSRKTVDGVLAKWKPPAKAVWECKVRGTSI